MLILIGLICGVIAVFIGAWSQACTVYEVKLPYNCPRHWHNPLVRLSTWFITAILSIIFAYIFSSWIISNVGDLIGKFSFGILLVARWFASSIFGATPAFKTVEEVLGKDD